MIHFLFEMLFEIKSKLILQRRSNTHQFFLMKYLIHDNGSRPFTVDVKKRDNGKYNVVVWRNRYEGDDYKPIADEKIYSINNVEVFIGKHPKCYYGDCLGKEFNGNSILLGLGNNNYVYIGLKIFEFKSLAKIKKFYSPVGNSDVPYSFAVDVDSNYYLLIEDVVLLNYQSEDPPYEFYYKQPHLKIKSLVQVRKGAKRAVGARFDPGIDRWEEFDFFRKDTGKKITKTEYIKENKKVATEHNLDIILNNEIYGRVWWRSKHR
jgi:hypothetical protein